MSSTSETGHAKNVANFQDLISYCSKLSKYYPTKKALSVANLTTQYGNATVNLTSLKDVERDCGNAVNARQQAFASLPTLSTRLINALADTDASKELIADAASINRKIQGKRAKPVKEKATPPEGGPTAAESKTISVAQLSYDYQLDHFEKLITLFSKEPSYKPAEPDLQLASLNTLFALMKSTNQAVINQQAAFQTAIISRNELLYKEDTGIVDTAASVKKAVRSIYGASSPEAKNINKIKFRGLPKKKSKKKKNEP